LIAALTVRTAAIKAKLVFMIIHLNGVK